MKYVPERGDFIWLDFDPQSGHEIAKRRPALVLSPRQYNKKTRRAIVCPITSQVKGYPFEVPTDTKGVKGVVLADQVRCIDWYTRKAYLIGVSKPETLHNVLAKIGTLINIEDIK